MFKSFWPLMVILALAIPALGQRQKVPDTESHFRLWAIDTTVVDSKGITRPAHADGKVAYVAIYNKTNDLCLVEYVAKNFRDHDGIKQGTDARVHWMDKHKTPPQAFLGIARAAGFSKVDLEAFYVRVK